MGSNFPPAPPVLDGDDAAGIIDEGQRNSETARERAVRIATSRVAVIGHAFELVARMGNKSAYNLDADDAKAIIAVLQDGLDRVKYGLTHGGRFAPTLKLRGGAEDW